MQLGIKITMSQETEPLGTGMTVHKDNNVFFIPKGFRYLYKILGKQLKPIFATTLTSFYFIFEDGGFNVL